jgi:hypothetical protein
VWKIAEDKNHSLEEGETEIEITNSNTQYFRCLLVLSTFGHFTSFSRIDSVRKLPVSGLAMHTHITHLLSSRLRFHQSSFSLHIFVMYIQMDRTNKKTPRLIIIVYYNFLFLPVNSVGVCVFCYFISIELHVTLEGILMKKKETIMLFFHRIKPVFGQRSVQQRREPVFQLRRGSCKTQNHMQNAPVVPVT